MKTVKDAIDAANRQKANLGESPRLDLIEQNIKAVDMHPLIMPRTGWLGGKRKE